MPELKLFLAKTNDLTFTFLDDIIFSTYSPHLLSPNKYQIIIYDYKTLKPLDIFSGGKNNIIQILLNGDHVVIIHSYGVVIRLKVTKDLIDDLNCIDKAPFSKGVYIGLTTEDIVTSEYGPVCKDLKLDKTYASYAYEDEEFKFLAITRNKIHDFTKEGKYIYKYGEHELFTFPVCPFLYEGGTILSVEDSSMSIKVGNINSLCFVKYNKKWHISVSSQDMYKFVSKSAVVSNCSLSLIEI
jgi:hypothetical protein